MQRRDAYSLILLGLFVVIWTLLAIDPVSRSDWVLENLLVWLTFPMLVVFQKRRGFTWVSCTLIFVFYVLHAIGGKWSYSNVPIPWHEWGFERNHYDRVVHLSWGLLLFLPARELVKRFAGVQGFAASLFAFCALIAASGLYEVIEWGAVAIVAPDLGNAFLGAQGDEFDASKDIGLAALGAVIAFAVTSVASVLGRRRGSDPVPTSVVDVRSRRIHPGGRT